MLHKTGVLATFFDSKIVTFPTYAWQQMGGEQSTDFQIIGRWGGGSPHKNILTQLSVLIIFESECASFLRLRNLVTEGKRCGHQFAIGGIIDLAG